MQTYSCLLWVFHVLGIFVGTIARAFLKVEGKPKIIDVALPTKSQNPSIITKVPFQLESSQKSILFRDVAVIKMRFAR